MKNFKKYKHKETGEIVKGIVLFDLKNQAFYSEIKYCDYSETRHAEGTKEFLKKFEEVKENENKEI